MSASKTAPEWLSPDEGETVEWVGEPELASKASELVWGILLTPLLGLGLLIAIPAYLQVKNTDYVVTNQSLYTRSGILSTNIQSVELDKIQNTEYSQTFFEKQLGYGTVGVATAGTGDTELEFEAIANAREIQELIRDRAKAYRDSAGRGEDDPGQPGEAPIDELADELRRTREALENVDSAISQVLAAQREHEQGSSQNHAEQGRQGTRSQQDGHGQQREPNRQANHDGHGHHDGHSGRADHDDQHRQA